MRRKQGHDALDLRGARVRLIAKERGEGVEQGQRSRSVRLQGVADGNGVKQCDSGEDRICRAGDVRTQRSRFWD